MLPVVLGFLCQKKFHKRSENEAIRTDCECGLMNFFTLSDASDETHKHEVDKYFRFIDSRSKLVTYWEE
jgi:hypothetical protein